MLVAAHRMWVTKTLPHDVAFLVFVPLSGLLQAVYPPPNIFGISLFLRRGFYCLLTCDKTSTIFFRFLCYNERKALAIFQAGVYYSCRIAFRGIGVKRWRRKKEINVKTAN